MSRPDNQVGMHKSHLRRFTFRRIPTLLRTKGWATREAPTRMYLLAVVKRTVEMGGIREAQEFK